MSVELSVEPSVGLRTKPRHGGAAHHTGGGSIIASIAISAAHVVEVTGGVT